MRSVSIGQKVGLIVALVVFIGFMGFIVIGRDYRIAMSNGSPMLVAREIVPDASALRIDNTEEKKLTVKCRNRGSNVKGYEFRISKHKNMWFSHSYKSEIPSKTIGKLKPGQQYYVQARCYKDNSKGRSINGKWCQVKGIRVKEEIEK